MQVFVIPAVAAEFAPVVSERQMALASDIWNHEEGADNSALVVEYDQLVAWKLALLGENAPAGDIDPSMLEDYCNLYKDRNGFKPRGHSYAAMKAWMDNIPPLEDDEAFDDAYEVAFAANDALADAGWDNNGDDDDDWAERRCDDAFDQEFHVARKTETETERHERLERERREAADWERNYQAGVSNFGDIFKEAILKKVGL